MSRQTRREFLKPAATMAASAIPYARGAGARPNILFGLADDWMWPLASIPGDRRHLDEVESVEGGVPLVAVVSRSGVSDERRAKLLARLRAGQELSATARPACHLTSALSVHKAEVSLRK